MTAALAVLAVVALLGLLLLNLYPPMGGRARPYMQSKQYRGGRFDNLIPTAMQMDGRTMVTLLRDFLRGNPKGRPARPLPVERLDPATIGAHGGARVTWFGHSALLLELDGKLLLVDPMFGPTPSPFPAVGGKRYSKTLPIEIVALPAIDAVLLSHDHYDHLDYGSMLRLKAKVNHFFVPLGVGSHLERWGVDPKHITEHDWWDEFTFEGLILACTPARHFSGRGLFNRNTTLWCSWVVMGRRAKVYLGADSGYGPHFGLIGAKYGPFDLTLLECGQYDPRWSAIHMLPEETAQANVDLGGKLMIPIHWAAFTLALHDWTDPVERVSKAAYALGIPIATPRIGEPVTIGSATYPTTPWWRE